MDKINKLRWVFTRRQKVKYIILLGLMMVAALLETLGIGLIVPFIGLLTNPEAIETNTILSWVYGLLAFDSYNSFLVFVTIVFLIVFIIKNVYMVFYYYVQNKIIYNEQINMSIRLFKVYMDRPYSFHLQRNSAELLRNVTNEVNQLFNSFIIPLSLVIIESITALFIFILLLSVALVPTLLTVIMVGLSSYIFMRVFQPKLYQAGKKRTQAYGQMIKWVQQGFGAGKEVKVKGIEKFFVDNYSKASVEYVTSLRFADLLGQIPRLYIETLLIAAVLSISMIIIFSDQSADYLITTLALFAMAAVRLIPSMNRVVSSLNRMKYATPSFDAVFDDIIDLDDRNRIKRKSKDIYKYNMSFEDSIRVNNLGFAYPDQAEKNVVKDLSFEIKKGSSVAITGPSGSGKTTILDIMLGIYEPDQGSVTIDDLDIHDNIEAWQKLIGYIPQSIYLSDDTVRNNVAFGIMPKDIDDEQVWKSLEQAQLADFVREMPEGLDSFVGENGVRLSGGQRQRVGIARALYHEPEILFLDEATSALDNETEKEVMAAIDGLKGHKTLIIVAHRLSTIENCDYRIELTPNI